MDTVSEGVKNQSYKVLMFKVANSLCEWLREGVKVKAKVFLF